MAGISFGSRTRTTVPFYGEFLRQEHLVRVGARVDAAAIPTQGTVVVTVGAGGAVAGATSVPVTALTGPIPTGTILDFTGAGKFALLTAAAAEGATTLTVEALAVALAAGDVATYVGTGKKTILAGTWLGRVRATETLFGPYATGDTEFYLTAFDVQDAAVDPEVELIVTGKNFTVVPERLPGWATMPSAQQTLVFDHYKTIKIGAE